MIYIIKSGSYENTENEAIVEGNGDIKALFHHFRDLYMPEYQQWIAEHPNEFGWGDELWNGAREARKRMIADGLTNESGEHKAFAEWLVREHGFRILGEFEEINADLY